MKELRSFNFLANTVYQPKACTRATLAACEENNFPTLQIIFEVTGSENIIDPNDMVNIFGSDRKYGFRIAIDDFNAGYTGLGLSAYYQPHILKLDMDLIEDIHTN